MVYVPWSQLGICRFHAMHKTQCAYPDTCRWRHPPTEEMKQIWDFYVERERSGSSVVPPGCEGVRELEPPPGLPPRPSLTRESSQWAPDVDDEHSEGRPASSGQMSFPPFEQSGGFYRGYSPSIPPPTSTSPAPPLPPFTPPDINDTPNAMLVQGFRPSLSRNPFVNGTLAYQYSWGNPLCVRCGCTGHLPKTCEGEALSNYERDWLYRLMREEQNRSKAEKAQTSSKSPASGYGDASYSGQEIGQPIQQGTFDGRASLLDVPMSPKNHEDHDQMQQMERDEQVMIGEQSFPMGYDGAMDMDSMDADSVQSKIDSILKDNEMKPAQKKNNYRGKKSEARRQREREKEEQKSDNPDVEAVGRDSLSRASDLQPQQPAMPIPPLAPPPPYSSPTTLPPTGTMGATKRLSNGEAKSVGPHPSTIRVSAPYITQSAIEKRLQPVSLDAQERSQAEAREDSVRLQGVTWLDSVRRALQLPVKTFTTACVYYHKFRLAHPTVEYSWTDAAAASLLTSCKNEDTLKKSRDILAAAYNMKQMGSHDQIGADDPMFESQSRVVIGLERLVLESGGFDFRSRSPHYTLIKIGKSLPQNDELKGVSKLAWTILTDLHRTFAPLKQTSATLALASLELAANFEATRSENNTCAVKEDLAALDLNKWHTTREEVMETLLDALDLYTHNTGSTILGTKYSLDDFLRIRLALNKECSDSNLPRYTVVQPPPSPDNTNGTGSTLRVANGHPTPVSPPQGGAQVPNQPNGSASSQPTPEGGGTLRFMLDPQRATDERTEVNRYYTEEWEQYEEEIEVPIPRNQSRDRDRRDRSDRDRESRTPRDYDERRGPRDVRDRERERIRESLADREREAERERARLRDRERERRYDDRRYEERDRDRSGRYDDRRERDRDRRSSGYYDEERRRGRDERR